MKSSCHITCILFVLIFSGVLALPAAAVTASGSGEKAAVLVLKQALADAGIQNQSLVVAPGTYEVKDGPIEIKRVSNCVKNQAGINDFSGFFSND